MAEKMNKQCDAAVEHLIVEFKEKMKKSKVTQLQLAQLCGTSQPVVSRVLGGFGGQTPKLMTLFAVAEALGCGLELKLTEQ